MRVDCVLAPVVKPNLTDGSPVNRRNRTIEFRSIVARTAGAPSAIQAHFAASLAKAIDETKAIAAGKKKPKGEGNG